jgi:hypothetical protein
MLHELIDLIDGDLAGRISVVVTRLITACSGRRLQRQ